MVSFNGKSSVNQCKVADDRPAFKNVGVRDFKVYSDIEKIKTRGRESFVSGGIRTSTKPPVPTRSSLPVKKGINQGCVENSDNSKSKHDGSDKTKVGRKVLADVSNVRSNLLRNRVSNGSKSAKIHSEKDLNKPKLSVGQRTMCASVSSGKPIMGTTKTNQNQGVGDPHTLRNVNTRDIKVLSNNQKTEGQNGRKIARKPLVPKRNSLPIIRKANQTSSSHIKGTVKSSEKVKVKVGRKVVPDISNARNHILKNRSSEGFISATGKSESTLLQCVPVGHSYVGAGALSRKSLRPIGRNTFTVSTIQMNSKSKCPSATKKSISAIATSSQSKDEVLTNAIPKNVAFVVSHESSIEKRTSEGDGFCLNKNTTDLISRTKCSRRRSFTSSLMAKSEVLKECNEILKQEKLPSIDDDLNHLEVVEYVDEIYQYYWVMEVQHPSLENYMVIQTDITPKMRGILINWLIEVHFTFELMQETLFLMVALFDRFLSMNTIERNEMQLVGLTALLLASKYEDYRHPKVQDLISIGADSYTRDQMLAMEKLILKKLMFRLNTPTPYVFMLRFLKAAQSDTKLEHLSFYLIELCLVEYEALKFKPSLLCASTIYVARCTLKMTPVWTPLLCRHTHYEESQLRDCANMILRFQKSAKSGTLKVTYEKYLHPDHCCVAEIKAMDCLPH